MVTLTNSENFQLLWFALNLLEQGCTTSICLLGLHLLLLPVLILQYCFMPPLFYPAQDHSSCCVGNLAGRQPQLGLLHMLDWSVGLTAKIGRLDYLFRQTIWWLLTCCTPVTCWTTCQPCQKSVSSPKGCSYQWMYWLAPGWSAVACQRGC